MSKTQDYKVMREHDGDKFYRAGNIRSLSPADAKHLVGLGVLVEAGEDDKKAPDLHDISDAERAKFETWIETAFSERSNAMQAEISALGERVAEAQKIAEHEITVLNETVADRRKEVEVEMEKLQQDVDAARKNADADIAEAANRKAEAATKNKADKPNANKAD